MTTIIHASTAQTFLSTVPHLCGFLPRRSLVVVPFRDGRSAGAIRIDLPVDEAAWAEIAATAIGLVCRMRDVTRFSAVVYADAPFRDDEGEVAFAAFMRYLTERAEHCGLDVADVLCVAADGWGRYFDDRCPAEGHPLSEIDVDAAGLGPLAGDILEGIELPVADLAEKERLGGAILDLQRAECVVSRGDASGIAGVAPRAVAAACLLDRLPDVFEEALEWNVDALDPYLAACLVWALNRPFFRDVALSQWSSDHEEGWAVLAFNERWAAGDRTPPNGPLRLLGEGPRPDPERLGRALALTRRLAAAAPRASCVGPLVVAAWVSWALGNTSHAAHYAAQATEIDPTHRFGNIIRSMVDARYLPPWAFERSGAASAGSPVATGAPAAKAAG